ncbi:MAG: amidohydrolase family protein, partial [Solirubrobacteraceae bacterium]
RAVPADQIPAIVDWAAAVEAPLHVHLSEQRAENDACLAAHGRTPAELLDEHGALGTGCCMVHATHLTDGDIERLGATAVCMCATTERDLADGIGPARALASPLCLGSDSHAVIDLLEEARAVELDERLACGERGRHSAAELLHAATAGGYASLGMPDGGRIAAGGLADLATIALDSVRLAGTPPAAAVFCASAADVRDVMVGGRWVVRDGAHVSIDVANALREALP